MDIKYYTKKTIVKCNRESIRKNRNRNFKPEDLNQILSKVPDDWKFPIVMEFPHNDIEMELSSTSKSQKTTTHYL